MVYAVQNYKVFCDFLSYIYQTMDKVQNKPYRSVNKAVYLMTKVTSQWKRFDAGFSSSVSRQLLSDSWQTK
jgi:hypothetical protein